MNAIKIFQEKHGLTPDGVIGKMTLSKIKSIYKITTDEALAQFMGNIDHETGGFVSTEENLNYSAKGLLKIFPKYFKSLEEAMKFERNPEAIANKVYAGRMGNNNAGDGWKFRGRGFLQTTGKNNYRLLGEFLGEDLLKDPSPVKDLYAMDSAIFYFNSNNLWKMAGAINPEAIRKVRKAVNGGAIGLEDVIDKVNKYYKIIKK